MDTINVILPVYNGARYLRETIESVLAQSEGEMRIILIDDGSTDDTKSIAQNFTQVEYFYQKNSGPGAAMNLGLSKVVEGYVAFIDADDLWDRQKTEKQLSTFRDNPDCDLVFGLLEQFHSPELTEEEKASVHCPDEKQNGAKISLLAKVESFEKVGLFLEDRWFGEFLDWTIRAEEIGQKRIELNEIVAYRRIHKSNLSLTHRDHRKDFIHVLKRSLDRKRAQHAG